MLSPPAKAVAIGGTLVGAAAFVIYSHSWTSPLRLAYDIPAALASYSLPALLLAEAVTQARGPAWWARLVAVAAMTAVTVGREFEGWPVSGHVTCVLAVAMIQTIDVRLPRVLRFLYWAVAAAVVVLRIAAMDDGIRLPLVLGLVAGVIIGGAGAAAVVRRVRRAE
jgi:hypothetical protein